MSDFRSVDQHSGFVATCRRMVVESVEGAMVTVGEAFLRRLDHDYDLPVLAEGYGRMECDGPDLTHPISAATATADDPAEDDLPQVTPTSAGSPPLTWEGWSLPAVLEVLADHRPTQRSQGLGSFIVCVHIDGSVCSEFEDWTSWSWHIAPIVIDRIACDPERAIAALLTLPNPLRDMAAADQRITQRLTAASDLFLQHPRR